MKLLKTLLLAYSSYEMWQIPADLWHKLSIVAGVLALLNLYEFIKERKEK